MVNKIDFEVMSVKNILFVVDDRKMGGVSVLLEDIMNNISLKDINVDLLILNNEGEMLNNLPKSINVIYGTSFFKVVNHSLKQLIKDQNFKLLLKKIYLVFLMKSNLIGYKIKKERKKILNKKYDKEIAFKDGFCGLFVGYGDSKEKIQWLHADYLKHDDLKNYRKLFQKIYNSFTTIVAISKPVGTNFNKIYGQKDKTISIYNFVNADKVIKKSLEENVSLSNKKINFISVGRFHPMKGFLRLINVIKKLKDQNLFEDCHLTLIGDGPELEEAKSLIKEYKLNDEIDLLGKKSNPFSYVKKADMFIMGSVYEPFGLTVIESLILNVPVISTKVATIKEMLSEEYGMIVDNSEQGLYNGLKEIIKNSDYIKKYKNNLKNYNYDTNEIIDQINKLLREDAQ